MDNDLISRSVVKGLISDKSIPIKFEEEKRGEWQYSLGVLLSDIYKAIDNAPPVEPFEPDYVGAERLKARQRGYEDGYHNGMKIGKTLNPQIKQGEWIDHSEDYGYAECPFCNKLTNCEGNIEELHYCWNCGAELKKGGA